MAKAAFTGFEVTEGQLEKLGRAGIRKIVEAGSAAAQAKMRGMIADAGHVRTGDLIRSVQPGKYYEALGAGIQYTNFEGDAPTGISEHDKAFIINTGRGGRRGPKSGDRFLTRNWEEINDAARKAMEAEFQKMITEA